MSKVAIVVLTDIERGEAIGRIETAPTVGKEFNEGGDQTQVIVSGRVRTEGVCMLNEFGTNMSFRKLENVDYLIHNF